MPVNLPLILVSASDLTNASYLISEIIDNEVIDRDDYQHSGRVWRLVNKYYRVDVQVCPLGDGEPSRLPLEEVEAHIIYITEAEEGAHAEQLAEQRMAAVGVPRAAVRLLVSAGERTGAALEAWARRRGYEPVSLRQLDSDELGVERARAALHAHTWRGLQRLDGPPGAAGPPPREADVQRVEAFAEALGSLGDVRGSVAALPDGERRRRAERVLAAFCRALGDDDLPL